MKKALLLVSIAVFIVACSSTKTATTAAKTEVVKEKKEVTAFAETMKSLIKLLDVFDAAEQCKEVTCLYNEVNWWLEDLINHPEKLDGVKASKGKKDFYL